MMTQNADCNFRSLIECSKSDLIFIWLLFKLLDTVKTGYESPTFTDLRRFEVKLNSRGTEVNFFSVR